MSTFDSESFELHVELNGRAWDTYAGPPLRLEFRPNPFSGFARVVLEIRFLDQVSPHMFTP
jgi:hypothetical protein